MKKMQGNAVSDRCKKKALTDAEKERSREKKADDGRTHCYGCEFGNQASAGEGIC